MNVFALLRVVSWRGARAAEAAVMLSGGALLDQRGLLGRTNLKWVLLSNVGMGLRVRLEPRVGPEHFCSPLTVIV